MLYRDGEQERGLALADAALRVGGVLTAARRAQAGDAHGVLTAACRAQVNKSAGDQGLGGAATTVTSYVWVYTW